MIRHLLTVAALPVAALLIGCAGSIPAPVIASEDVRETLPVQSALEVRYIANEGVLISTRNTRVLIDGLHRKYKDAYAYLPDAEREKLETARPPFDNIDLILVSHMHGDHFSPESVGLHLKHNPKATLVTSQQVADEVAKNFKEFESVKSRVTAVPSTSKARTSKQVAGIDVEFIEISHGTERHASIQNLGHLITLGGKKILHVGDAEIAAANFADLNLDEQNIDIAFLPAWFLTTKNGQALVREHIRPKHIIAVHVGPSEAEDVTRKVKQNFPQADVFTTMLDKRFF